jgi:hypothetical protein
MFTLFSLLPAIDACSFKASDGAMIGFQDQRGRVLRYNHISLRLTPRIHEFSGLQRAALATVSGRSRPFSKFYLPTVSSLPSSLDSVLHLAFRFRAAVFSILGQCIACWAWMLAWLVRT